MNEPARAPSSFGPSRRAMVARDVQNARTLAYWLLSHERIGVCATAVDGLDSELLCIEGELDEPHGTISACGLERELAAVLACVRLADPSIAPQLRALITAGRAVSFALAPQRSGSGIRRAVRTATQPIRRNAVPPRSPVATRHQALAHAAALAAGSTLLFARTGRARGIAAALLASHAALAFVGRGTPRRRAVDWIWGVAAALLPLSLGYARRDALAAAVQAAAGAGVLAGSVAGALATPTPAADTPELLAVGL